MPSSPRTALLDNRDSGLALKLIDAGLLRYESSQELVTLRRRALDQLRERYQQLNPFKFILIGMGRRRATPAESTVAISVLAPSVTGRSSIPMEGVDVCGGWRG